MERIIEYFSMRFHANGGFGQSLNRQENANTDANADAIQYAGFGIRLKAFLFDYLPIAAYIILLFGFTMGVTWVMAALGRPLNWPENPLVGDLIAFLTLLLPVVLYFTLQESSPRQATWGKRKAGLLVVDEKGGQLTFGRAFVRSLLKFLPWQIAHTSLFHWEGWPFAPEEPVPMVLVGFGLVYLLVGVYIASALVSKKHSTPYNWVVGSFVVEVNFDG
jgi:uncharacterized RDD family membrane protein YckC